MESFFKQTNERFSQLKDSLKDWVATELYKLYHIKMIERRTTRKLSPDHRDAVISSLYKQIQNREIWISYDEVKKYAFSGTKGRVLVPGLSNSK
jgi:hypothetical protein